MVIAMAPGEPPADALSLKLRLKLRSGAASLRGSLVLGRSAGELILAARDADERRASLTTEVRRSPGVLCAVSLRRSRAAMVPRRALPFCMLDRSWSEVEGSPGLSTSAASPGSTGAPPPPPHLPVDLIAALWRSSRRSSGRSSAASTRARRKSRRAPLERMLVYWSKRRACASARSASTRCGNGTAGCGSRCGSALAARRTSLLTSDPGATPSLPCRAEAAMAAAEASARRASRSLRGAIVSAPTSARIGGTLTRGYRLRSKCWAMSIPSLGSRARAAWP
mmetsp:Transcript_9371/g.27836  ORF Transcript_9371/g.27836 Transcript_9371/m.27836 type:complete len:281 (-) Transcript_9371:105-947(-)